MKDIVRELQEAMTADKNPWDATLYQRAAAEIARLRADFLLLLGAADLLCRSAKTGTQLDKAIELYEDKPVRDWKDWN